ncbi:MAG TPA: hypothetical protein VJ343_02935 [archaeon]|nr:hypothetical protein [archaeon]
MKKGQAKIDEFAFVLLAGIILIVILMVAWGTPSEAPPFVQPNKISLDVPANATSSFELNVTGKLTNVTLSAMGQSRNWFYFNKNNFDVIDSTMVRVRVSVPNVAFGTYTASIIVESPGGKQTIPVTLLVKEKEEVIEEFSRPMLLGEFSVSYSVGTEVLASEESFEVSRGYFSGYSKNMDVSLTDEQLLKVSDGSIHLEIADTNSAGSLIVLLNGIEVYSKVVGAGDIDIPIDKEQIEKSNTIEIKADTPGWEFWMSTVYRFNLADFAVNYKGVFTEDIPFTLSKSEIDNFDHFQLNFRVRNYTFPLPQLIIKINGQIVSSSVPPLGFFNNTFERDILGNTLALDSDNIISFLFEKQAYYEIDGAVLTVYYSFLE